MAALSFKNPTVQHLRRLIGRRSARHGERLFVVDGPRLTAEAAAAGWTCVAQFVPAGSDAAVDGAGPVHELADGVLERISSTESPQPPIAVFRMPRPGVDDVLSSAQFAVVLHQVRDPGNVGTIMRSAEAAGADTVVLTPGSVDAYSPKVVRAAAGALFHLSVVSTTVEQVRASGLTTIGTSSHDHADREVVAYDEADLTGRPAFVVGNEAAGLPAEWTGDTGPIDRWVTVRHQGRAESLNVAMATTVLVFEAARQRRTG